MFSVQVLYKSRLLVAGVTLIVLGLGNYLAAIAKVPHYQELVSELGSQIPQSQPLLLREGGKPFPSEIWERWEIARAKLDYYYVVLSGGRLMIGVGLGCAVLALIKLRRRPRPALI